MDWSHLTPEQAARAEGLYAQLQQAVQGDLRDLAALLASKPDHQLFGQTEFQVRDRVHRIGAEALQIAAEQRKKGATKAPA